MTISEVGEKYGLPVDTLRYYEKVGLIPEVNRKESGIRDYTPSDCGWVEFIKCMRSAGLSIETLVEYVSLYQKLSEGQHCHTHSRRASDCNFGIQTRCFSAGK